MASRRELEAMIVLSGRINPSLANAMRQSQRGMNGIGNSSNLMGKLATKGFAIVAKAAQIGTLAVGAGLAYVATKGIQVASDLTEVQNVVDTTFGKSSKVINEWSKTALKAYGLSELSAKQYTSTMGAMLKSSGLSSESTLVMSQNLAALAGDMGSFYNLDPTVAFNKIRAGISGETEPLKQLGINMSVANLEAYAMSKGIKTSYQNMDQAAKTTLRYNYLLSATKDSQGDFARTFGTSLANQFRVAKTSLEQMAGKIMTVALPGLTKLLNIGNKLLEGAMGNPEFIKKFQDTISSGMDKLISLLPSIQQGFQKAWEYVKLFYNMGVQTFNFIKNNWGLIEPIIWGMVAAQLAFNVAAKAAMIIQSVGKAFAVASTMLRIYRTGIGLATALQYGLNAAWVANPIGIVITAIGLLVAVGVLLYKNFDKITTAVSKAWSWLTKWNGSKADDKSVNVKTNYTSSDNTRGVAKYAYGGFANKASIFGEAGPEMAIPIKPGNARSIELLNKAASMLGVNQSSQTEMPTIRTPRSLGNLNQATKTNSGGNESPQPPISLTFNFNGPVSNKDDVAKGVESSSSYIKQVIEDFLAEKRRLSFE